MIKFHGVQLVLHPVMSVTLPAEQLGLLVDCFWQRQRTYTMVSACSELWEASLVWPEAGRQRLAFSAGWRWAGLWLVENWPVVWLVDLLVVECWTEAALWEYSSVVGLWAPSVCSNSWAAAALWVHSNHHLLVRTKRWLHSKILLLTFFSYLKMVADRPCQ